MNPFLEEIMEAAPQAASYPKAVQGRVAHIDADFLAYMVSAYSKEEIDGVKPKRTLDQVCHNATEAVKHLTAMAGATDYRCHITPSASNKGGRAEQAIQLKYQGNRDGRDKPELLDAARAFIGTELNGIVHLDQEADDGLAQANYDCLGENGSWGTSNLSIIISKDKDLRQVPGLHMDWETGEHFCTGNPFGSVFIDDTKSQKKLSGWGTKFFWAQMLMGDPADNIKGLPGVAGTIMAEVAPTKAYQDLIKKSGTLKPYRGKSAEEREAENDAKINAYLTSLKLCGPQMAYDLIFPAQTDKDCFEIVRNAFQRAETVGHQYLHWKTGKQHTATQAMLSDMQLLWMRRNKNPNDVLAWVKEIMT